MTMDDPGWGGYVPPSEPAPPVAPAAPSGGVGTAGSARPQTDAAQGGAGGAPPGRPAGGSGGHAGGAAAVANLLNTQQVAKVKTWLSAPKNKKIALGGAAVVLIIIIVAAIGLGGGGGGLSKAQYIQKADAICTASLPLMKTAESNNSRTEAVSVAQTELSQLKALGLPNQDPQAVTSWLNAEQAAVTAFMQDNASQSQTKAAQGAEIAAAYGLKSCAS